jgi:ATP-dependent helicase HrpB
MSTYMRANMMGFGHMTPLPIDELAGAIPSALRRHHRLVIEAPTGSGKSTRVPGFILDSGAGGAGEVVVMQPRRIAARMLARRVAYERGVSLGGEVGYQVRFDNRTGPDTRIRFETDGIILRRLLDQPDLAGVGTIVFDEFHERHLYGDVMLALAMEIQRTVRPDLNLVVMSATLDAVALETYLASCAVLRTSGRMFPVAVEYLPDGARTDRETVWELAAEELVRLIRDEPRGDALVFMPGAYEIQRTIEAIRRRVSSQDLIVLPLHGELPPEQQDAAMERTDRRRAIVATNVAETSLTIDGITIVVDSGLARKARFDPHRGINTLRIEKISRASADQRTGRAGRTAPGRCLRLWSERDDDARPAQETPEIRRMELSEIILLLKHSGIGDPMALKWLDQPDPVSVKRSVDLLTDLGALDVEGGTVTDMGRRLLAFPLHPRAARMLVAGAEFGCVESAALAAAIAQEPDLHRARENKDVAERRERRLGEEEGSDFLALMRSWRYAAERRFDYGACSELGIAVEVAKRVARLREQFLEIASEQGFVVADRTDNPDAVCRCILTGYADQVARRVNAEARRYELVHGRRATLDRESVVRGSSLVVAASIHEIGRVSGDVEVRIGMVSAIKREWLEELSPGAVEERVAAVFDTASKRVVGLREVRYRDLVIESGRGSDPDPSAAAPILAAEVRKGNLTLKEWDHSVEQWIVRVNLVAEWFPEFGVHPIDDEARATIVEQVCLGAIGYKELKDRPVWPALRAWLPRAVQGEIDRLAPERIELSNGRNPKVTYARDRPPTIALRIQELYGISKPITVAAGRVRVVVQVLAPNFRPVQVTDDLASFWANSYPAIKKEYQRKYPKHEWR